MKSLESLVIVVSVVLILSCGQTHRQTESHTHIETDADERLTSATIAGVSTSHALC